MNANEGSIGASVVLAPLLAGAVAALANLVNFVADRPAYFAIWGLAHLLAFGFGLWAARVWRPGASPNAYLLLGLLAGAVEALIVFGALDGLVIVSDRYPLGGELMAGVEDYVAATATVVLFAAGAMHGLRKPRPGVAAERQPLPSGGVTEFLTAAGPLITIVAGVLKEVL